MLQAPAEAIREEWPDARKTALNTRTGTEMLKTLFCGLRAPRNSEFSFLYAWKDPFTYRSEENTLPRIFFQTGIIGTVHDEDGLNGKDAWIPG